MVAVGRTEGRKALNLRLLCLSLLGDSSCISTS